MFLISAGVILAVPISIPSQTCMESPLILSPLNLSATSILSFVFPTAVGPTIAMTVCFMCIPLNVYICMIYFIRYHKLDKLKASTYAFQNDLGFLRVDLKSVHRLFLKQMVCLFV